MKYDHDDELVKEPTTEPPGQMKCSSGKINTKKQTTTTKKQKQNSTTKNSRSNKLKGRKDHLTSNSSAVLAPTSDVAAHAMALKSPVASQPDMIVSSMTAMTPVTVSGIPPQNSMPLKRMFQCQPRYKKYKNMNGTKIQRKMKR